MEAAEKMDIVEGSGADRGDRGAEKTQARKGASKPRDDAEIYRARLSDKGFNPGDYGDALSEDRPLKALYSREFPAGTEARLQQVIAETLEKQGGQ